MSVRDGMTYRIIFFCNNCTLCAGTGDGVLAIITKNRAAKVAHSVFPMRPGHNSGHICMISSLDAQHFTNTIHTFSPLLAPQEPTILAPRPQLPAQSGAPSFMAVSSVRKIK